MAKQIRKPVHQFKELDALPSVTIPNTVYYVLDSTTGYVKVYITDNMGVPKLLLDTAFSIISAVQSVSNIDGSITVVGSNNVKISLSSVLQNLINSALQSGDNISELINDESYITLMDLATVAETGDYSDLINKPTSFPPSSHTHPISDVINLQTQLDNKVDENTAITGATKTKITYDSKGLVTNGVDATTADIIDSINRRYVTDLDIVDINNLSGINSGDQTSIVGITGTKAQYNTSLTDGDFLFVGDITQYTDEQAQDAVGNILTDTDTIDFTYNDGSNSITADIKPNSITNVQLANNISVSEFINDANYATEAYADALVVSVFRPAGSWDASGNTFPIVGTGTAGAIRIGDTYNTTVAGTPIGFETLDIGDSFYAIINSPGQTPANWKRFESNTQQSTESFRGTTRIVTQAVIEDLSTTNDTDSLTAKKFYLGWEKIKTLAQTFAAKITFTTSPRFNSGTANTVPYLDSNKDLTSSVVTPAELDYVSGVTSAIQTQLDIVFDNLILKEDLLNKKTTMTGNESSNIFYLTAKAVYDWAVGLFVSKTTTININGVSQDLSTNREWRTELSTTGALTYGGATIASATQINVGAVTGIITNNETTPGTPSYTLVSYAGGTNITVPTIGGGTGTYVLLNSAGTLVFQNTFPTSAQRKSMIYLSKISHTNLTSITFVIDEVDFVTSPLAQFRDLFQVIQYMNQGIFTTGNSGLTINTTNGNIVGDGINFVTDKTNPNTISITAGAPRNFIPLNQSGAPGSITTVIDPTTYDVGGVTTTIPGSNARSTNQYFYYAPGVGFVLQRGQTWYPNLTDALAAVGRESFVVRANLVNNAILIAVLCLRKGATNMNDTSDARILIADKFGQIGGAAAGISVTNLQTAYNNGSVPQIQPTDALGAVTIKNARALNTSAIQEWQNIAGTTTASITGNGNVYASSFIKSGGTSSQFLKADGSIDSNSYALSTSVPSLNEVLLAGQASEETIVIYNAAASVDTQVKPFGVTAKSDITQEFTFYGRDGLASGLVSDSKHNKLNLLGRIAAGEATYKFDPNKVAGTYTITTSDELTKLPTWIGGNYNANKVVKYLKDGVYYTFTSQIDSNTSEPQLIPSTKPWTKSTGAFIGVWSGATAYVATNLVSYNGWIYQCITNHTNHNPELLESPYWVKLGFNAGTYNGGSVYYSYNSVVFSGEVYTSNLDSHTYPLVTVKNHYWDQIKENSIQVDSWGDSLTFGTGSTLNSSYTTVIQDTYGIKTINFGVPGETSTQIKNRFLARPDLWKNPQIIWSGRNNFTDPTTVKADIAAMIAVLGHEKYLVLGIIAATSDSQAGILALNADLKTLYGGRFIDVQSYLVDQYNSSISQDVTDHAANNVPFSLRSDWLHLNNLGYEKVANVVNNYKSYLLGNQDTTSKSVSATSLFASGNVLPLEKSKRVEILYASDQGVVQAYDRIANVTKPLSLQFTTGSTLRLLENGGTLKLGVIPSYVSGTMYQLGVDNIGAEGTVRYLPSGTAGKVSRWKTTGVQEDGNLTETSTSSYTSAGVGISAGGNTYAVAPSSTRGVININGSTDQFITFAANGYIVTSSSLSRWLSTPDLDFVVGGPQRVAISATTGVVKVNNLAGTGTRTVVADASGNLSASGLLPLKAYTVATLPAGQQQGTIAFVTDALAPTYLVTIVGGGAVVTPVFYNGSNWVAH